MSNKTIKERIMGSVIDIDVQSILFIVYTILKLTGVIDWSWWWITSPLWIPTILYFIYFIVALES